MARQGSAQVDVANKIISEHELRYNPRTGFYEFQKNGIWKQVDDETIMGYI